MLDGTRMIAGDKQVWGSAAAGVPFARVARNAVNYANIFGDWGRLRKVNSNCGHASPHTNGYSVYDRRLRPQSSKLSYRRNPATTRTAAWYILRSVNGG